MPTSENITQSSFIAYISIGHRNFKEPATSKDWVPKTF
jgi:hypothetical protein